ncbi:MAG: hypothetical protein RBS24_00335 [Bacilli bacterium]|nr:hypothetical protein [Bacilli bacterium]
MELEHWISLIVATVPFLAAIIVFLLNMGKELKFKKLEQKTDLYLRYISSSTNKLNPSEQREIFYKMLLTGSDEVINILKEIHFPSEELDVNSKADLIRKLLIAMRTEFTSKRSAKILACFPEKAFK